MKFAHDFDASLKKEEYPQGWVDSAISYRQLKKCIKKVQRELHGLGLDPKILEHLWQHINSGKGEVNCSTSSIEEWTSRPYHYCISADFSAFKPKLTVAISPQDGSPIDAWLSPETREYLRSLPRSQPADKQSRQSSVDGLGVDGSSALWEGGNSNEANWSVSDDVPETVEIPLTSDSEFFQLLKRELSDLSYLQEMQQKRLGGQIDHLGGILTALTEAPSSKRSQAEIEAWREIFRRYVESQVFFSTTEQGAGIRSAPAAQQKLEEFGKGIVEEQKKKLKLSSSSKLAVKSFLAINTSLLQFMKFQEINRTALTKIMKKFDKRTALHAQVDVPALLSTEPFIAQTLAKAACFTIQEKLLPIVPQLIDYLCPVCFSISYRPIRLSCNHVFCIRCLIVMQRTKQGHCPLCRGDVVMEASSDHLDTRLMAFLAAKFPTEVKAKQKENQHAAGVDRYGENFDKCVVM